MRNLLLTVIGLGLIGFGMAAVNPAYAAETSDQAAAEGFVTPAAPSASQIVTPQPDSQLGNPANPNNGLAQQRIWTMEHPGQQ